jgi:phage tail sheath protein FI
MPEYLAPGVYVEEVELPAKSIEGVSTSTKAFVGSIRRGLDALVKAVAIVVLGMLVGVAASIAVDKWHRRRQGIPPTR